MEWKRGKEKKVLAHDLQRAGLLLRRVTLPVPGGGGPGPLALDSACLLPSGARPFANGEKDATVGKGGRSPSDPRDGGQPNTPGFLSTASRQLTPLSSSAWTGKHTSGIYVSHARVCVLLRGEDLADAAERVAGAVVPRRRGAGAGPPWCTRSAGSRGRRRPRRRPGHALRLATGDVAAPEAVRRGCGLWHATHSSFVLGLRWMELFLVSLLHIFRVRP